MIKDRLAKTESTVEAFIELQCKKIREQVGEERVLLGLSGGVDSSVCAALLTKAIPGQLVSVYVDHGLMRLNESDEIEAAFAGKDLTFIRVDAGARFLAKLAGVSDPEEKRKIIGAEFVAVFNEEAAKLKDVIFLAQGTNYADIVESGKEGAAFVKSHHNVGGLPEDIGFTGLVEPLAGLLKEEIREVGKVLGLPRHLYARQPFPGPGLAVRVLGEVTEDKLCVLRQADAIFRGEVEKLEQIPVSGQHSVLALVTRPDQYFAVHTGLSSVGVSAEGERRYGAVIALRAIYTKDFMAGTYTPIPHDVLARISARIITEVPAVGRVVYDITSKPPGTIEWE
ncbi:MAG: glutamine-hydrolyzing GMP synthase [Defluviitaleaceae bacterium]|nr:glutamine-hydrolyzing GMP synthase [Defluviitaleaceae bacterium]